MDMQKAEFIYFNMGAVETMKCVSTFYPVHDVVVWL